MQQNDYVNLYNAWLEHSEGWMKKDLISLKTLDDEAFVREIEERFSVTADFGTGGLRNVIRAGLNGINDFWIRRICRGISKTKKSVVIACDTRNQSKHFSEIAAETLSQNGCDVYLFREAVPTPVLSFAVKKLSCEAGIVITASHNPREYNGFKVYDENGVQYTPGKVEALKKNFSDIPFICSEKADKNSGKITILEEDFYSNYFDIIFKELSVFDQNDKTENSVKVIYSALHGTGANFVPEIMRHYAIDVHTVGEQMIPDGDFKTVKVPNPENSESFVMALELSEQLETKPQLLLATDPDADRLGVFVYDGDDYKALNGNELGMLLLDYIVSNINIKDKKYAVLKTIVTTEMVKAFVKKQNIDCYETLTGFKYLGEKVVELKKKGIETLFSFEESFGYLYGEHAGDKDACSTSGLLALMLNKYQTGEKLLKRLDELRKQYGFYREALCTHTSEGLDGKRRMDSFISFLTVTDPETIWNRTAKLRDYNNETGELRANVLEFVFSETEKVIFRPSGTEPKIKAYLMINDSDEVTTNKKLKRLEADVMLLFRRI